MCQVDVRGQPTEMLSDTLREGGDRLVESKVERGETSQRISNKTVARLDQNYSNNLKLSQRQRNGLMLTACGPTKFPPNFANQFL